MRYVLTFLFLAFALAGCPQPNKPGVRVTPPPSGQGHYTTDDGMRLTLFTPIGRIKYGETKSATISEGGLVGFVLGTNAGDRPSFTLRSRTEAVFSVTSYGPRSPTGLWGDHRATHASAAPTQLNTWTPQADGDHFVLLRVFGAANAEIEFTVTCDNCQEPDCQDMTPCNTYCPDGLVHDADGCLACACEGATCPSTGCRGDDLCVFPCGRSTCVDGQTCLDGRCEDGAALCGVDRCERGDACVDGDCRPAAFECKDAVEICRQGCSDDPRPVCGVVANRRQTFVNRCAADCVNASPIMDGRCESRCGPDNPCEDGLECIRGQCRPNACECPEASVDMQVCGVSGMTHRSECHARCADDTVAYPGECRENSCQSHRDCRFDEACVPVQRDSMVRRFNCDPATDPNCVLECRPLPRCSMNRACPRRDGQLGCYPVTANEGICLPTCDNADADPCPLGRCASILHRRGRQIASQGLCLPECETNEQCPGNLNCLPDLNGVRVCQTCACSDFPEEPVCTDQGRFANRCEALCAGLGDAAIVQREVEICDELDNDCDGNIDEGLEQVPEVCDGVDNNCNGAVDEGIARQSCGDDVGQCRSGMRVCQRGQWSECVRAVGPVAERCDELDNDCDGNIDEGLEAIPEMCDGRDNDCDGRIDETNAPCPDGEACQDANRPPLARECGLDHDNPRCGPGRQECSDGQWGECFSIQAPVREVCDGEDNDCDGHTDEAPDANGQGPDGGGCEPVNPCEACPANWDPVCSGDGIVYSNECEARCSEAVDAVQPLEACYEQDVPLPTMCRGNEQCREMGRDGLLCLSRDAENDRFADVGARLSDRAQCIASTGDCACIAGRCGFVPTMQTRRCLPMAQPGLGD